MKITSTKLVDTAKKIGWQNLRDIVYGNGGEKDAFRNSAEGEAMQLFLNSRQDWLLLETQTKIERALK